MVLFFWCIRTLKNASPVPVERDFLGMRIALQNTTTDAFVGLDHYEDDILIPGNALMPWSSNSLNSTSYLNNNIATASY